MLVILEIQDIQLLPLRIRTEEDTAEEGKPPEDAEKETKEDTTGKQTNLNSMTASPGMAVVSFSARGVAATEVLLLTFYQNASDMRACLRACKFKLL